MVNSVGHAFALYGSAAEHSAEHITAAFGNPITANIAMSVATQAVKGVGLATGMAGVAGMTCSGAAVVAVAGAAYDAVKNHSKISRERAEEVRRANQKAQDCQESLELTEDELARMCESYRRQHRTLASLRSTITANKSEIERLRSGEAGSNVRRYELQLTRLNAELAHRDAQIRELSRNLVVKQSEVNSLAHERAERRAEVERLAVELAGKDRDVGRLIQESEEKDKEIASVRQQAISQQDEISDLKHRCSQLDSAFHESSDTFQMEWDLREHRQMHERDLLRERAERLSGDVEKYKRRLNEERARYEALVQETCSSLQAENAQLTASLAEANDKIIATESRATRSEGRIADIEARVDERVAGMEANYWAMAVREAKASDDFERKTAEVESLTRHLEDLEAKTAAAVVASVAEVKEEVEEMTEEVKEEVEEEVDEAVEVVEGVETLGVVGDVEDVEDVRGVEDVEEVGEVVEDIEDVEEVKDMGDVEDVGGVGEAVEVDERVEGADTDDRVSAPMGQVDIAQEAGTSIVHDRVGSISESRDSNGAYTTAMLVGEGDEMLLLPKGTRQGALMALQGDFGVTMGYDRTNRTVSIKGATLEVQRSVVARLRSALVHCDPAYGQDPGYSFLVLTNMAPPPLAKMNDHTFTWWRGKMHAHCHNHGCVGDLVVPSDKRVGSPRPRQLGLTQDWDVFVWGLSWAVRDLMAVPPDDVRQAARDNDKYEVQRAVNNRPDECAMRQVETDYTREGMEEGTEVRMPRPALIALASPQRLEAAVNQAVADVAAAAGGAGMESTGSRGESNQARVKAWANLVAGKVVISGQHPREVMHVREAMEASLEEWNRLEVTTTVSNRAGRGIRSHATKLSDISQEVEVPLVVYSDGGLCGVTRHTEVRGRAQTEEIAVAARRKLEQMKELGGPLWCKEMENTRDQATGVKLEDRGGNEYQGTASQRYRATDGSRQDHVGGRHVREVQPIPPEFRPHQQVDRDVAHRQQTFASRVTIGGDYAVSGGGFGGGEYQSGGGNNYLPPFTPSPTAVSVPHYPVADMPPVTYQHQQLPRAMIVQQHGRHHVCVEGRMRGAGGVPYHYGADARHVVPRGPPGQGQHAIGSITRILPLPCEPPCRGDAAVMYGTRLGPPPPAHTGNILHHQNVARRGNSGFFAGGGGTSGRGESWTGSGVQHFHG